MPWTSKRRAMAYVLRTCFSHHFAGHHRFRVLCLVCLGKWRRIEDHDVPVRRCPGLVESVSAATASALTADPDAVWGAEIDMVVQQVCWQSGLLQLLLCCRWCCRRCCFVIVLPQVEIDLPRGVYSVQTDEPSAWRSLQSHSPALPFGEETRKEVHIDSILGLESLASLRIGA